MALVRLFLIISLFVTSALSAELSKDSTATSEASKNYSLTFETSLTSSLHKTSDIDHSLSNDYSISPSFQLDGGYNLIAVVSGTKDLKGEREFLMGDGSLGLSSTLRKYDRLTIAGSLFFTIPLSENSKDLQNLRTSVKLTPKFIYKVADGFSAIYVPSAKVNFHEYKTSLSGGSNTQYSLSNTGVLSYSGFDSFSLSATATYARGFTYSGNSKDAYAFSQSVTYLPTDATSVTLGHAIGGNPLKANGIDNEIEIFDERNSSVFAGFSFTY